jgi:hypothetical protein
MSHWLEEEIKKLRQKELQLDINLVKENYETYQDRIHQFFEKLIKLYDDLKLVMKDDFEFSYRDLNIFDLYEYEFIEFSAINKTQKPAFLRRLQFVLSDQKGMIKILLFRGKHNKPDEPWKFHDEQEFHFEIDKFDDKLPYELIDWFAWKRYSPRSLR